MIPARRFFSAIHQRLRCSRSPGRFNWSNATPPLLYSVAMAIVAILGEDRLDFLVKNRRAPGSSADELAVKKAPASAVAAVKATPPGNAPVSHRNHWMNRRSICLGATSPDN